MIPLGRTGLGVRRGAPRASLPDVAARGTGGALVMRPGSRSSPAKQRSLPASDWLEGEQYVSCPDQE